MTTQLKTRSGLTLIECLITLGILALLTGLILPAIMHVRENANKLRCGSNLHQIAIALHSYHDRIGHLPPATVNSPQDSLRYISWHTRILSDIGEENLWQETLSAIKLDSNASNVPPHLNFERGIPLYQCPSDGRGSTSIIEYRKIGLTAYLGITGRSRGYRDGVIFVNSRIQFSEILDGTSNTLMVGERPAPQNIIGNWYYGPGLGGSGSTVSNLGVRELADDEIVHFACPSPANFKAASPSSICGYTHFWSFHPGGANFVFCDGSVRFVKYSADDLLPLLSTRSGGESISSFPE